MLSFNHAITLLFFLAIESSLGIAVNQDVVRRSQTCVAADISTFKSVVTHQPEFCHFWQQAPRVNSPFKTLVASQVDNVCQCILGQAQKRDDATTAPRVDTPIYPRTAGSCDKATRKKLKADFSEPKAFCKFYNAAPRNASPFPDFTVADLLQECKCILSHHKTTMTSASASTTGSPTIVSTASATADFCSSHSTATLVPVANPAINRSALSNLQPVTTAVLDYAQAYPGINAASIQYDMLYPQVTLENSAFIQSVTCASGFLTLILAADNGSVAMISQWPQTGLVLITNSTSCNSATTRGVYLVQGWINDADTLSYTYNVSPTTWKAVAEEMVISYGTITNGSILSNNASECTTTYSNNATATATSTSTSVASTTSSAPFVTPTSFDDLSPEAQDLVLRILYKTQYNPDGTIKLFQVSNSTNATAIPMAPYNPNNSTMQKALLAQLDAAGLPAPSALVQAAQDGLLGLCPGPSVTNTSSTSTPPHKRSILDLSRRDDTFEDYACNDYVEAVFGDYDDAVCGTYDLIANRQAVACLFTGCYEQTSKPSPPVYTYTFSQDWTATFGLQPNSEVVTFSDGSSLTCISCGLSLSKFKLSGSIVATLAPQQVTGATLLINEFSETDMIFQLNALHPVSYNWNSTLSTGPEQSITVEGIFTLTPNVVFSMGVQFSADSAINVQGGASMSVNNAQTTIDLSSLDASGTSNWAPSIQQNYPTFNESARVQLVPYIRRLITVDVNILNQDTTSIALGSVSSLGYDSEYLTANGEVCVANQLQLKSNIHNANSVIFGNNQYSVTLNNLTQENPDQCFNVPSDDPTLSDIAELRSVAQEFCTAYNNYIEPTSGLYLVSTQTTLSTATASTTSTVEDIPTVTTTTSTTAGKTRTIYSTALVTANSGDETLDATYLQKRGAVPARSTFTRPTATATANVQKRQITYPSLVADWPASKISYACSQVATGVSTATFYTSTATVYNGTVTTTSTQYTAFQGPAVTSTSVLTAYAWSTTTVVDAQKTIPASCPLQTQVSCFNVIGHGPAGIEGQYLTLEPGVLNPTFSTSGTAFYLSCEGQLTALPDLRVLGGPGGPSKVAFNPWGLQNAALCTRDAANGELNCLLDGSNLMYAWTPTTAQEYWVEKNLLYVSPRQDASLWVPTWGFQQASNEYSLVTLTTQSITCPCNLDVTTENLASVDATTPRCPASDGTLYKTSDGTEWQIQCSTAYTDASRSTTSAPDLISCLNLCDADLKCTGSTWDSSTNTCVLRSSMLSDSYPTAGSIHSVIRLQNPPTCPSSGSQLFSNGGFESGMENWVATVQSQSPSQYGIRSPGDNSGDSYEVTFSGTYVELELQYVGSGNGVYLVGGVEYTISGNYMTTSNAASSVECTLGDSGYLYMITGGSPLNSWQTETSTFTPTENGYATLNCYWVGNPGQSIWIDNISLNC